MLMVVGNGVSFFLFLDFPPGLMEERDDVRAMIRRTRALRRLTPVEHQFMFVSDIFSNGYYCNHNNHKTHNTLHLRHSPLETAEASKRSKDNHDE